MPHRGFIDKDGNNVPFAAIDRPAVGRRPLPVGDRLLASRLVTPDGCWIWEGGASKGDYGIIRYEGRNQFVHRVAYTLWVGSVPVGLHLDHLCRVRRCFNPRHLEPVTPQENHRRSMAPSALNKIKTHCLRGHELSGENLNLDNRGRRQCRTCKSERARAKHATVPHKRLPDHCMRGHHLTEDNTYRYARKSDGYVQRQCRTCRANGYRAWASINRHGGANAT